MVEIEHSKDLSTAIIEELKRSLEAQELHLTKRNSEIKVEQLSPPRLSDNEGNWTDLTKLNQKSHHRILFV